MTDFFADLEREIRAAHPRRSRPVVPVKGIAATAAVAATLVAVVLALGALAPTAENEVATQPTPDPQPTAVTAADCNGKVVDGRIPDELVDRFAILRGDAEPVELRRDRIPPTAAEVIRQSVRVLEGPGGRRFAFAIVRMGDMNCAPSDLGVCLFALDSADGMCEIAERSPLMGWVIHDIGDGKRLLAAVGDDTVDAVQVDQVTSVPLEGNVGFEVLDGEHDPSITPLNCAGGPDMGPLKKRFAVFREPVAKNTDGIELDLPQGFHTVYLTEARVADFGRGLTYAVVPVGDSNCGTAVCLVRVGDGETSCSGVPESAERAVVLELAGGGRFAALVTDGVRSVTVATSEENMELKLSGNVVAGEVSGEVLGVSVGS